MQHLQLEGIAGQAGSSIHLCGDWGGTVAYEGDALFAQSGFVPPFGKGGARGDLQPEDVLNVALAWAMPLRLADGGWLNLTGEGQFTGTLAALQLQHRLTEPLAAQLDAEVQPLTDGLPWAARLHIEPLHLAEHPALLKLVPPEFAPKLGTLAADFKATGTQTMAQIERAEVQQDKTRLNLSGQVDWAEDVHWDVQAEASELHPELFAQDWPGTLALAAQSKGRLQDGKPIGVFKLERLQGKLRDYPLEASLNAEIKAWTASNLPQLVVGTLKLRSGGSTLEAKGSLGETFDLTGKLNSANLAEFVPQAGGRAQANFAISGRQDAPNIKADVQGQALTWQDMTLATLNLKAEFALPVFKEKEVVLSPDAPMNFKLDVQGLRQSNKSLMETAQVDVRGSVRAHDLQIGLVQGVGKSQDLRLNLQAQGAWDGTLEHLRIQSATLDNTPTGSWISTQAVELVAGADQFTLPEWCGVLTTPPGKAQACVQGQWRAGKDGSKARLDVRDFNLSGLDTFLKGKPLQLRGVLGGFVALDAPQGAPLRIQAALDGQNVVARVQTGLPNQALKGVPEWRDVALDATHLEAEFGGSVGRLAANVGINDANRIEMQVNLPGLNLDDGLPQNQPMQGYVDLRFEDNSLLAGFLPMLKEPQGRLAGRLLIAGTLDEPKISGGVQVVDGRVVLPDLGVRVTEGQVLLRADASNVLTLEGSALLGSGKANLSGRIDLADFPKWQAKLHIGGQNLTVMRLPNASVQASPDLTLNLSPGTSQVSGRVDVPQALFDVGGFGAGALRRSSDVRILGEVPSEPASTVDADVLLVLGDNVRIEGLGFKGRVQGQIRVLDRPSFASPRAQGELQLVDARYRAYGQDLNIEQGRLLFADSPLTDPGLDIRAVRRVTENDVVVGLHITGRASAPKIALFSQPSLPQSEMLSYLVTGRSSKMAGGASTQLMLQLAQGAGLMAAGDLAESSVARDLGLEEMGFETALGTNELSLVLGKYLTPRLYLRYVQGLGNGVQSVVLTYDWTRSIQVRGQVGTRSSGLDVFYRFER